MQPPVLPWSLANHPLQVITVPLSQTLHARGFIDLRIEGLRETLAFLANHREESLADPHVPRRARFIFDHSRAYLEAELAWTRALRTELRERGSLDGQDGPG